MTTHISVQFNFLQSIANNEVTVLQYLQWLRGTKGQATIVGLVDLQPRVSSVLYPLTNTGTDGSKPGSLVPSFQPSSHWLCGHIDQGLWDDKTTAKTRVTQTTQAHLVNSAASRLIRDCYRCGLLFKSEFLLSLKLAKCTRAHLKDKKLDGMLHCRAKRIDENNSLNWQYKYPRLWYVCKAWGCISILLSADMTTQNDRP